MKSVRIYAVRAPGCFPVLLWVGSRFGIPQLDIDRGDGMRGARLVPRFGGDPLSPMIARKAAAQLLRGARRNGAEIRKHLAA